jgi:hypothetical protein
MPEWFQWLLGIVGGGGVLKLLIGWLDSRDRSNFELWKDERKRTDLQIGSLNQHIGKLEQRVEVQEKLVDELRNDRSRLIVENNQLRLETYALKVEVNDLCQRLNEPDRYKLAVVMRPIEPDPPRQTTGA